MMCPKGIVGRCAVGGGGVVVSGWCPGLCRTGTGFGPGPVGCTLGPSSLPVGPGALSSFTGRGFVSVWCAAVSSLAVFSRVDPVARCFIAVSWDNTGACSIAVCGSVIFLTSCHRRTASAYVTLCVTFIWTISLACWYLGHPR